jgi:hypothetical protein
MIASDGATDGIWRTCSSSVMMLSAVASPKIAVKIGVIIATAVPSAASSTITAAARPTASANSASGLERTAPTMPPGTA